MIGLRIRRLREKKGYSISQLAMRAGISKSYLSQIERNLQVNPSLHLLSKLARTLDATLDDLIGVEHEDICNNEQLDRDWEVLIKRAIEKGMSKEDFKELSDYIRFKHLQINNSRSSGSKEDT
ncbi:XRE family transcriptional regulator [Pseudoneobacillus rhizosphaerae]|jgi:XRE family transcriptional regulator, master regulator for biofilm formation|uniref:HTH-type transcriptional regulator SinR n=1 Tax=Pseudoneobacillus rhizosphaerae TaxID=2880968 RepID=A0A9C7L9V8_9BACI|nr:XRE family transcriptional regulator [Pseudoneobacillus rhizosphaerae]CAG9607802.1 HTH-type transcriptional regulator SinR [Pseudoneobacillus rhizosphaerae]